MIIDKTLALSYLAGSDKIYSKLISSFLDTYKNYKTDIINFYENKNYIELYRYIHNIKGISLNLGSQKLYSDSIFILEEFKKGEYNFSNIEKFINTLELVYFELSKL